MVNGDLIWGVLGLPLVGAILLGLLGPTLQKSIGKRGVGAISTVVVFVAFILGLLINSQLVGATQKAWVVTGPDWIAIMGLRIPFESVIDPLSMTMVLIVTGIGALIHLYSTGYMAEERDYSRFFAYLNLFIVAMLVLVLGNSLPLLFIGWEGVGLCSYLLIGFWYQDRANVKAANKAFIVNRIGDWSLMMGMFLIAVLMVQNASKFPDTRIFSFDNVIPVLGEILKGNPGMATAIALLLFGGAAGKSAQFPLYVWLPDAMAGPTPVSALIHAATMVTSGVVLLNRFNVVFQYSPTASAIVCVVGAFTALFAALIAFGQTDIKKVLAYSTVSQLGFMFIGVGAGGYWTGMFHVTTHAFFKALLFLGSGAVIHAMAHDQDMRNYGQLRKYLPITFATMAIGWISIIAIIPGLGGAGSKEEVIGYALANNHAQINGVPLGQIAGWTALGVAFLTAMYMTRMFFLTFLGNKERWRDIATSHSHETDDHHHALDNLHQPHEVPFSMSIPLVVLALLSVAGGYLMMQGNTFEHWIQTNQIEVLGELKHEVPNLLAYSLIAAWAGLAVAGATYIKGLPASEGFDLAKWSPFRKAAGNQFGFDAAVDTLFNEGGDGLAVALNEGDHLVVDGAVNGSASGAAILGSFVGRIQTGFIRLYALFMLIGGVGIVGWFIYVLNSGGIK
jgi:NADH-quinone oxidoreductase subunit L